MDTEHSHAFVKPFVHQVAGHMPGGEKTKLGFLECSDSTVLKPSQKPETGSRESQFYQSVFDLNCDEPHMEQLRRHLPKYFGTHKINGPVIYLKLENVASKFRKPCIADIKIGRRTYDPNASPVKIARSLYKYPHNERLGFQIAGMRVYHSETDSYESYDKWYCRNWGEENIMNGLDLLFAKDNKRRIDLIKTTLDKLKSLEDWFQNQRKFAFYSSSILIVFEGDNKQAQPTRKLCRHLSRPPLVSREDNSKIYNDSTYDHFRSSIYRRSLSENDRKSNDVHDSSSNKCSKNTDVELKMIDFTHVWNTEHEDKDYLFGLQNLIHYLKLLLEER